MCFRPAETNAGVNCPECGKKINYTQGVLPKKCPFCKTSFEEYLNAMQEPLSAPAAPSAPGSPKTPDAPSAPKPPGPPSAPSSPKVPNA